jgi:uncharacterized protein DUF6152
MAQRQRQGLACGLQPGCQDERSPAQSLRGAAPAALFERRLNRREVMSGLLNRPRLLSAARHMSVLTAAACLAFTAGPPPALAHHAFAAEYDGDKPIDLSGVVTKARWVNPHSWLYFDVRATDGSVTNWGVEMGAPNALAGKGLLKTDLQSGAEIHVKGYRAKNGGPYGYAVTITLHDGRTFLTGGAQDVPPQGGAQK